MQAKPYVCIACYNINNMRHKHTFDFNFPPAMFPVVLPHFLFPVVYLSCCHSQSWLIQYCILVFLMTHEFSYISQLKPVVSLLSLSLSLSISFSTFFFLNFSFPYHFSGCFILHFCQVGLSGHSIQCCNIYRATQSLTKWQHAIRFFFCQVD